MFLFQCCQTYDSGQGYQIISKNSKNQQTVRFIKNLDDLKPQQKKDKNLKIIQKKKSQYDQLINQYKGTKNKWTDQTFPPISQNIGKIQGVTSYRWKRISEILSSPVLFDDKIQPQDVIQGSLGDCYFLSALAALAQQPDRIQDIFDEQKYNQNGIYKVTVRNDGVIQQILLDDYIPVNEHDQPLFCQNNKNQFWVLILQKAWAKIHGNYANIVAGNPTQVFKAFTFAPADMIIMKQDQQDYDSIWQQIYKYAKKDYPCCCGTTDKATLDWDEAGLVAGHAYTLVNAANFTDNQGKTQRVLKLRNPWGKTQWTRSGSEDDKVFWNSLNQSVEKKNFLANSPKGNDGIFTMKYEDFRKYFSQIHICMFLQQSNYITQFHHSNGKNGQYYQVQIEQNYGEYTFELHQSGLRGQSQQRQQEGLSRATLVLGKKLSKNKYQFSEGVLKYNEEDTKLTVNLENGIYLLYAKLDRTRIKKALPEKSTVSIYSQPYGDLKHIQRVPGFLQQVFLSHGRKNKRQSYNNDTMWISWKLLFQQGGYAYVALGNFSTNKKFVLTFNQKDFNEMNFSLKKPFKGKGDNQILEVMPNQQRIVLSRVMNTEIRSLKFPPKLGIKIEAYSL